MTTKIFSENTVTATSDPQFFNYLRPDTRVMWHAATVDGSVFGTGITLTFEARVSTEAAWIALTAATTLTSSLVAQVATSITYPEMRVVITRTANVNPVNVWFGVTP